MSPAKAMTVVQTAAGHDACGGKTKAGTPCTQPAGWGTSHVGVGTCKLHGGSTRTHVAHAADAIIEMALMKAGIPIPTDPAKGLLDMVAASAGMVRYLGAKSAELEAIAVMTAFGPAIDPHIVLYEKWVKLHARNCKLAIDANIGERYVRLAEEQGQLVVDLIRRVLGKSELASAERTSLERLFGQEMRAMAGELS